MSKVTSFILKIKLITIFGSKVESDQSASVRSSFRMCECLIMAVMSSSEKLLTAIVLMFWSLLDARIMGILARFPRFTQIWTQVQSFGASPISLHLRHTRTADFKSIGSSSLKICSNTSAGNLWRDGTFIIFLVPVTLIASSLQIQFHIIFNWISENELTRYQEVESWNQRSRHHWISVA